MKSECSSFSRLCTRVIFFALGMLLVTGPSGHSQKKKEPAAPTQEKSLLTSSLAGALKFRSLGPATVSGRISDLAVNPVNPYEYFVGVAFGGLWKTTNAGVTFEPVFDDQPVFSIGCITIDPANPKVVWVGTGENNSQRNLAYGDGVYKTLDGGKSWKNMGLKKSEHIGKIMIDPRNSEVVYVCSQGPAWGPGGERGLFKTTDGGQTWKAVLTAGEYTGASDMAMDPRYPDVLFVAMHQRERREYSKINGGPESAIYKSTDGGASWKKLSRGLPSGDVGRIGLALSPANPDVIYAIIELQESKGGFYRSTDRGESWEKRSDMVSGSPQYYQEIYADPVDVNRVVSMDVRNMVSDDGGKTFYPLGEKNKHVDNHAMWIDPSNTNHYLMGCDGGLYESFDRGENWTFKTNLPITQYYHVRVDNRYPFYYLYGGTQDNGSWQGPSRTIKRYLENADWTYTLGGDGFLSIPDPVNPDISYHESQYCGLVRYDFRTGNTVSIKPQPKGSEAYRFNWNTPYLVSAHDPSTLYCAANKVFKSTDRGDSWVEISPDLTRQIDPSTLPMMGKIWPPEAVAKGLSTSPYGNIYALAESPLQKGLLYAGTDDGLLQVTEDDGKTWTKIDQFPGVPSMTMVKYLIASQHNAGVVYAAFDNKKSASDFTPYLLKSSDKGRTWTSIASMLPSGSVYCIAEDHGNPNLLFVGNAWGVYVTIDGGKNWLPLKNGIPTIEIKDLAIQKRENDLAVASFGRGFYILEDYSYLRELSDELLKKEAYIFPIKDALLFYPSSNHGGQGEDHFRVSNPSVAATFTYYLRDEVKTLKDKRKDQERADEKAGRSITYPTDEQLLIEAREESPYLLFTILDENDQVVNHVKTSLRKGINRASWNLDYPSKSPSSGRGGFGGGGLSVPPGTYKVIMEKCVGGQFSLQAGPVSFQVNALDQGSLAAVNADEKFEFLKMVNDLNGAVIAAIRTAQELRDQLAATQNLLVSTPADTKELMKTARAIDNRLFDILTTLSGPPIDVTEEDVTPPSVSARIGFAMRATGNTHYGITGSQREQYELALKEGRPAMEKLQQLLKTDVEKFRAELDRIGVPWTSGRMPQLMK